MAGIDLHAAGLGAGREIGRVERGRHLELPAAVLGGGAPQAGLDPAATVELRLGLDQLALRAGAPHQPAVDRSEHHRPAAPRDGHGEAAHVDHRVDGAPGRPARPGRTPADTPSLQGRVQFTATLPGREADAVEPHRGRLEPACQGGHQVGPDPDPVDGEERLGSGRAGGEAQRPEPGPEGPVDLDRFGQLHRPQPGPQHLQRPRLDARLQGRAVDDGVQADPEGHEEGRGHQAGPRGPAEPARRDRRDRPRNGVEGGVHRRVESVARWWPGGNEPSGGEAQPGNPVRIRRAR